MMKSTFLGAAATIIVAVTSPAVAQDAIQAPGVNAQTYPWATDRRAAVGNVVGAPVRGQESFASYDVGRNNDNTYALYYGDRPVSRRTTCGLQSDATYMGPDGRWYPC